MKFIVTILFLLGTSQGYLQAEYAFYSGNLYLRDSSTDPAWSGSGRDPYTLIPIVAEGYRVRSGHHRDTHRWNETMLRLWDQVNRPETHFTVRAGDEYLIYQDYLLLYVHRENRTNIHINPEELWTVLSQCRRPASPAMAQTAMEGWFPGLESPVTSFVTTGPVMDVIQELLNRGRNATLQE